MFFYTIMNIFITLLENINKSCSSAGSLSLIFILILTYFSPSVLDHSCTANAVVTFQRTTLYVTAVEDIPEGQPSQVTK
jgi:hypothetical protein